jgi:hypothetical protein
MTVLRPSDGQEIRIAFFYPKATARIIESVGNMNAERTTSQA